MDSTATATTAGGTRPRVAVVTGGSRGLGRNTAVKLGQRGVGVIVTWRSRQDEADAVVAEVQRAGAQAAALPLDVGDASTFAAFAARVRDLLDTVWKTDRFDYLVNNAGIGLHAPFDATTEVQFDALCNVHLKGPFFLTQALLPLLADGGRIVNLSTGLTRFAMPGYAAYAAMKGGVEVLTRYLAKELGARRIAVNTVAPGAIETDFGGGAVRDQKPLNEMIASQTALGRVGLPDDIGDAIASLLDEGNRWIDGQRIEVSGGIHL